VSDVSAIVLAAGESRRMGAVNKLLLPFGEATLIERVVGVVEASEAREVVVVVGHEAAQVREALREHAVVFAENTRYREGMTTSIHAGVRAAAPEASGFMICLSDLPLIEQAELNRLLAAFEAARQEDAGRIVVPVFGGQRGNPVIFPAFYRADILGHGGLMGCKGIVQQNPERVVEVAMPTDHVLRDADTPEAYARLRTRRPA
jgi:molybdenum cofactor cytidylyltransferase